MILFIFLVGLLLQDQAFPLSTELLWEFGEREGPEEMLWEEIGNAVIVDEEIFVLDQRARTIRRFRFGLTAKIGIVRRRSRPVQTGVRRSLGTL